jgi:hypothetical protein
MEQLQQHKIFSVIYRIDKSKRKLPEWFVIKINIITLVKVYFWIKKFLRKNKT